MNALAIESTKTPAQAASVRPAAFCLVINAVLLVAVAVGLRVWRLDSIPGINGDEAWSGVQAARLAAGESIEWWTPTGNPINLFFLAPLAALHLVFVPSFALLRSISLASGILALVANYALCRRVFDTRTAVISTVLLALLPINIAYSRFAWDASQSLLATLLVLYLPLWHYRRGFDRASLPVGGMLALAAAIYVHPTNSFAAPLLVVPMIYAWRNWAWKKMQDTAVPAKPWILGLLAIGAIAVAYLGWQALSASGATLRGPDELGSFVRNYVGLFSGASVYEYISGVDAATGPLGWFAWLPAACQLMFAIAAAVCAYGMIRRLKSEGDPQDVNLVSAWAIMLLGFFLVAGPRAIAPHYERYAICLVAPGALLLARGLAWWLEPQRSHARAAVWIAAGAAWLFPLTFYFGYFDFIQRTGGRSHLTFRTGAVEPKRAAFEWIDEHRDRARPTRIVASAWWNYWPLAYLALGEKNLRVIDRVPEETNAAAPRANPADQTWYVEFTGSAAEQQLVEQLLESRQNIERHVLVDGSGQGVVSVLSTQESSPKNY